MLSLMVFFALVVALIFYLDRCKKCGSWLNFQHESGSEDSHMNHIVVITYKRCVSCKNKVELDEKRYPIHRYGEPFW